MKITTAALMPQVNRPDPDDDLDRLCIGPAIEAAMLRLMRRAGLDAEPQPAPRSADEPAPAMEGRPC